MGNIEIILEECLYFNKSTDFYIFKSNIGNVSFISYLNIKDLKNLQVKCEIKKKKEKFIEIRKIDFQNLSISLFLSNKLNKNLRFFHRKIKKNIINNIKDIEEMFNLNLIEYQYIFQSNKKEIIFLFLLEKISLMDIRIKKEIFEDYYKEKEEDFLIFTNEYVLNKDVIEFIKKISLIYGFENNKKEEFLFILLFNEMVIKYSEEYIKKSTFIKYVSKNFNLVETEIEKSLSELIKKNIFIIDKEDKIIHILLYEQNKKIYNCFDNFENDIYIGNYDNKDLNKEQNNFIDMVLSNKNIKYFILNGSAGTGKTTTIKYLIEELNKENKKIICCSLSGMATNRIKNVTFADSKTIHSLMNYDGIKFNNNNEKYDYIIVDESTMINNDIFLNLLIFFKSTTFIFIGDNNQLKPIGIGNPFYNIINSGYKFKITLKRIYRQDENDYLYEYTQNLTNSKYDYLKNNNFSDINFLEIDKNNLFLQLKEIILKKKNILNSFYNNKQITEFITYFQFISPLKKGDFGTNNLNKIIQNILNHKNHLYKKIEMKNNELRIKDKVIHLKNKIMDIQFPNDYKKNKFNFNIKEDKVLNGQIGVVISIEEDFFDVFFPNENYVVRYNNNDSDKSLIDLAYCLTVHKTQGSEFNEICFIFVSEHFLMLDKNIYYTALTRSKNKSIVIGEIDKIIQILQKKEFYLKN